MSQTIINGDSLQELQKIKDNTIDAVITDPPYGIAFLGKDWDSFRGTKVARSQVVKNLGTGMRMTTHTENLNYQQWCEQWARECLRVLKPGGWLLAFSAARLYHRIATGIEDAGFEVRDQIMWLYSSGFPKAQQIPTHPGWKTCLKPAHEPIVMARKRLQGSCKANMVKHGVGALNIDQSRIPYEDEQDLDTYINNIQGPLERSTANAGDGVGMFDGNTGFKAQKGRVVRPQAGRRTASFSFGDKATQSGGDGSPEFVPNEQGRFPSNVMGEVAGYQKYFYCPKVSRRERHRGYEQKHIPTNPEGMLDKNGGTRYIDGGNKQHNVGNNHPTVKPVELMKYLVRLVTPAGAHIIDPFAGSGSTGMACRELGRQFTGIELDPNYCEIARRRIEATLTDPKEQLFE